MRLNNYFSNSIKIPFQKKLVAECNIKKGDKQERCNIYKLDRSEDNNYFDKYSSDAEWKHSRFMKYQPFRLWGVIDGDEQTSFYVMEDLNNNLIGYCNINDSDKDSISLSEIETKPILAGRNENRGAKYIGETLLAFLTGLVKRQNKKQLLIPCVDAGAVDFYFKKCGFEQLYQGNSAKIKSDDIERFEKQNEEHTGSKITFIG